MRRINDALHGEVLFDLGVCTYVYLSVTLGKDRHIHTVTLGKDRHVHIRIYACAHEHNANGNGLRMTEETALERRRRLARDRECYRIFQVGWLLLQFVQATIDEKSEWEFTTVL